MHMEFTEDIIHQDDIYDNLPFDTFDLAEEQVEELGAYLVREAEEQERLLREYELWRRCLEVDSAQDSRSASGYGGLL